MNAVTLKGEFDQIYSEVRELTEESRNRKGEHPVVASRFLVKARMVEYHAERALDEHFEGKTDLVEFHITRAKELLERPAP